MIATQSRTYTDAPFRDAPPRVEPTRAERPPEPDLPRARGKGLCVNCAHRFDCAFPAPEGGVWYCEEYA